MKHGIPPKNAVETDSLQTYFQFSCNVYRNFYTWFVKLVCFATPILHFANHLESRHIVWEALLQINQICLLLSNFSVIFTLIWQLPGELRVLIEKICNTQSLSMDLTMLSNAPTHKLCPIINCVPTSERSSTKQYCMTMLITRASKNQNFSAFSKVYETSTNQVSHWYCCNLSAGVALNLWFTTNGMCVKISTTYMWREQAIIEWLWRGSSADVNVWMIELDD